MKISMKTIIINSIFLPMIISSLTFLLIISRCVNIVLVPEGLKSWWLRQNFLQLNQCHQSCCYLSSCAKIYHETKWKSNLCCRMGCFHPWGTSPRLTSPSSHIFYSEYTWNLYLKLLWWSAWLNLWMAKEGGDEVFWGCSSIDSIKCIKQYIICLFQKDQFCGGF